MRSAEESYSLPVSGSLVIARWASLVAGVALFTAAVIGMQYGEQGLYQSDALRLPQVYGQDLVALVIALPLMMLAVWRTGRGSPRGLLVWAGTLVYIVYWYHFYLANIAFGPMFLMHLALVGSSLLALGVILVRLDVGRLAHHFRSRLPARSLGGMMVILAALFATAWVVDIVQRVGRGELLDQGARSIYSIDLTVMLPLTIAAGILLWRHHVWGYALSGPLLVNAFLSMLTLWATALLVGAAGMQVAPTVILIFSLATLVMIVCVLAYLRDLSA